MLTGVNWYRSPVDNKERYCDASYVRFNIFLNQNFVEKNEKGILLIILIIVSNGVRLFLKTSDVIS